ncbi:MAG TPA: PAS domain-containing protein [Spirochaetes bacterium]|nr:PAS domain-containing protein [Spirochaetota bacterium]
MTVFNTELNDWLGSKFLNEVPMLVAVLDAERKIIYANDRFTKKFGEWANRKWNDVLKKEDEPRAKGEIDRCYEDGISRKFEETLAHRDYLMVHAIPVLDLKGGVTHMVTMSDDITDIRTEQMECAIFFERVPSYISVIGRDFTIIKGNDNLRDTFGECVEKKCYEAYKKRDAPCEDCPAALSFMDGQEHTATHVGIDREGGETHYVVTTSPLIKGYKDCQYVVEIMTDITRFRELEAEKLEAERLAAVGQTVAGLAHTVKNILMGIEGGMYIMSSGIEKDRRDRIQKGWTMLQRNIEKVSSLVKDFLSFAKGRKPELKMVDPDDLVSEILELYTETARGIGVTLRRGETCRPGPAPLDPEGIHTCLTNLVSNAIDACQVSAAGEPTVEINAREENGALIFEVSDNGIGMDYDVKQKVFTTFFTTKGGKGTGLGLLTTYKIVQEHGGKILVDSEPGKGSIFRVVLPLERLNAMISNK